MFSRFKPRRINPMLLNVLVISGLVHLVAGLILGGITIVKYVVPDDTEFDEPPPTREEKPPPDVKVEVKPQPAKQNQPLDNLRMKQVGDISISDIDVDLPSMDESFTVSSGIGGVGGGALLGVASGRIGLGMSDISVFGLKSRAERVLFVIEAGREMVVDEKGGLNSYRIIKKEILSMVGNLSPGTLFNVMVFENRRAKFFKDELVPSGTEVTEELGEWLKPINEDEDSVDLRAPRAEIDALPGEPVGEALPHYPHRNDFLMISHLALEQPVDAIFMITGYHRGYIPVRRRPTESENAEWEKKTSKSRYQRQLAEHKEEKPEMRRRVREKLAEVNEERRSDGLPPKILSRRHGIYTDVRELELEWETPHPGWQPHYHIDENEVEDYFRELVNARFKDKGREKPSFNIILFLAGDEELSDSAEDGVRDFVRDFRGKHRVIRGLDEIEQARSAADTRN